MKKYIVWILIALLAFACCSCETVTPLPDADAESELVKTGEIAARQGEWIYFINGMASSTARNFDFGEAEIGSLVRMTDDRSRQDVVVPQIVLSFTIVDEWIYYIAPKVVGDDEVGAQYCRCRIDGTGHKVLADVTDYAYFEIAADRLYCCNNGEFYTCDHNFGKKKVLAKTTIYSMKHSDGVVYYSAAEYYASADSYYPVGVYSVNVDGTNPQQLNNKSYLFLGITPTYLVATNYTTGQTEFINRETGKSDAHIYVAMEDAYLADDNTVLLFNYEEESGLYVYHIETRKLTALFSGKALEPRLYNGTVYFYNVDDNNRLYTVKADGSEEAKKLCKHSCGTELAPQFLDGYLYYMNADDSDYAYRINLETGYYQYIAYIAH